MATHLLKTSGHYSIEFRKWIRKPEADKTYVNLKTFIQEAYNVCIEEAGSTTAGAGFSALVTDDNTDGNTVATMDASIKARVQQTQVATHTADGNVAAMNATIQQLSQLQMALMQQMTMLTMIPTTQYTTQVSMPAINTPPVYQPTTTPFNQQQGR